MLHSFWPFLHAPETTTIGYHLQADSRASYPHRQQPAGGFGLGVERTVAWIAGEEHIRQCIPFPRIMDKVYI